MTMETKGAAVVQKISTDFIRLDAFLKLCGAFETGGQAKAEIQGGSVRVNGETCLMRGKKLRPGDRAEYGGKIYEVAAG
jgi:ribosome-associated protein